MVRDNGEIMKEFNKNKTFTTCKSGQMLKRVQYGKRKGGFTLAEALIAIAIIGVVAAMTIPILVNKYQDFILTSRFKKGYATLSQAWHQVVMEEPDTYIAKGGWSCRWATGESGDFAASDNRIMALYSKMKVTKTCRNQTGCWPTNFENSGDIFGGWGNFLNRFAWITVDGMCISGGFSIYDSAHIAMDTNCNKPPNKLGDDIFSMLLGADGVVYFATDSTNPNDSPVKKGLVCPYSNGPFTVNGRRVDFRDRLKK